MDISSQVSYVLEEKALDLFKECDLDGKGYLTESDFANLNTELQLGEDAITQVFHSLSETDESGNEIVTKEKFTSGFGTFFRCASRRLSFLASHDLPSSLKQAMGRNSISIEGAGDEQMTNTEENENRRKSILLDDCESGFSSSVGLGTQVSPDSTEYESSSTDWDPAFTEMLSQLAVLGIEPEEHGCAELWQRLEREDPFTLPVFEKFLRTVTSELTQTKSYCHSLAQLLRKKTAEHDETITTLHDDLEDQVRQQTERIYAHVKASEASERRLLERELAEREEREQELNVRLAELEERDRELSRLVEDSQIEAQRLSAERDLLENQLANKNSSGAENAATNERMRAIQHDLVVNENRYTTEIGKLQAERDALQSELNQMSRRNSLLRSDRYSLNAPMNDRKSFMPPSSKPLNNELLPINRSHSLHQSSASSSNSSLSAHSCSCHITRRHHHRCCHDRKQFDPTQSFQQDRFDENNDVRNSRSMEALMPTPRKPSMEVISLPASEEECGDQCLPQDLPVDKPPLYKVVFLGDSGVGKTAILHRLCYDQFRPAFNATIGMDLHLYPVSLENSGSAHLQLWDTAGQERYRCMTRQYFRNADAFVLVYDILCESSFLSCRWWLEEIESTSNGQQIVLFIGNKLDMANSGRAVSPEQAKNIAMERGMMLAEVSAKTGFGVHEVIRQLAVHLTRDVNLKMRRSGSLIASVSDNKRQRKSGGCCS